MQLYNVLVHAQFAISKMELDVFFDKLYLRVTSPVGEQLKDLRKLGNSKKFLNMRGDIAKRPVSLPEIKLWQ